jgi:tight adherence protein B
MTILAVALAALGGALSWPTRVAPNKSTGRSWWQRRVWLLGAPAIGFLLVARLNGQELTLALIATVVVSVVIHLVRRGRAAKAASVFATQVLEACESMAADLAVGQPQQKVLDRVAQRWPEFAPVAMAGQMGADVPEAMRALATTRGGVELHRVAATWQVASATGSGLAQALEVVSEAVRTQRRITRLVETELAGARATSRLLAVLPLGVLAMGQGIGGDPFVFLLQTTSGLVCLALGATLTMLGLLWLDHISASVLEQ